jgi:hypothetical protein
MAPSWRNSVTLRSGEMFGEYVPAAFAEHISLTPLLLLPAADDRLMPTHLAIAACEKAREPKRIEILPGGHFDIYTEGFEQSSTLASDWFLEHLARCALADHQVQRPADLTEIVCRTEAISVTSGARHCCAVRMHRPSLG